MVSSTGLRSSAADGGCVAGGPAGGCGGVGACASGGQRPSRRDGLRRDRPRAAAAEREHVVGGPALRSGESRRERRASRSAAPPRRAQVPRGGEARRSEGDVEAARADAVPDGRRSRADLPGDRFGRELPARARPGNRDGSRLLHQRWRDVLARGVRERARPGHRRTADRQPSWLHLFRDPHGDASAGDGGGCGRRRPRDAGRQRRRRRHDRRRPSHERRPSIRSSRARAPDRGHAPRQRRCRRRPQCRRRHAAHRRGDQLSDLRGRRRRPRRARRSGTRPGIAQGRRRATRLAHPRLPAAVRPGDTRARAVAERADRRARA